MKFYLFSLGISALMLSCQPGSDSTKTEKSSSVDYLRVPGPLFLMEHKYQLAWSSHPSDDYFKQEYLPSGQVPEHYNEMILLEVALGDKDPQNIALAKAKEINTRKMTDPIAAYNLGKNQFNGEVLLDFILSQGAGENTIAEWNIYRYKPYTDEKGQKGIVLFGWSRRVYGSKYESLSDDFLNNRKPTVIPFMEMPYPEVRLGEK